VLRVLESPRARRRLSWLLGVAVAAAVAVPLAVKYANTGVPEAPIRNVPVHFEQEPVQVPLKARDQGDALAVAGRFLETAVARRDLDQSWELASPALKTGMSRKDWRTGNIPVIPYPVDSAKWKRDYSYTNRIGLQVAVFPKPGAKVKPVVFDMDLVARGTGAKRHWLVEAWVPAGGSGLGGLLQGGAPVNGVGIPELTHRGDSRLSGAWLIAPLALIGGTILFVPLCVGCRQWYLGRRARLDYARERAAKTSA
jgi:hypothetical protein